MNLFLTKEALYQLSYVGNWALVLIREYRAVKYGAGDETRTRDIQLGRLELYQLSYSRQQAFFYYTLQTLPLSNFCLGTISFPQENVCVADEAM